MAFVLRKPRPGLPTVAEVRDDEDAYLLYEVAVPAPDGKSRRRMQYVVVVRGDGLAEHATDLGDESLFVPKPINVVGGDVQNGEAEHSVAELRDIANFLRMTDWDPSNIVPTDLVNGYFEQVDQKERARRRIRTYGPRGFAKEKTG